MKKPPLKDRIKHEWRLLAIAPTAALVAAAMSWTGFLQPLEWKTFDRYVQWKAPEAVDSRIVVITIDDHDIEKIGHWPISDQLLVQVIQRLNQQQPRVIVLDLYRNLPVEPGYDALNQLFETTPNLIGAQKRFGTQKVPPPPTLAKLDKVGMTDVVVDLDGTVRRGLLSAQDVNGKVHFSLGTGAALQYLAQEKVIPEPIPDQPSQIKLGRALFQPLDAQAGGYSQADAAGYQILMNYRAPQERFQQVSLTDVLTGSVPQDFFADRIVFIGSTGASTNDFFHTPYDSGSTTLTPGVFIHANLASQIISAALDGRPLLQTLPDGWEIAWSLLWSAIAVHLSWQILQTRWVAKGFYGGSLLVLVLLGGGLWLSSYGLFLANLWLPVVMPMMGLGVAAIATMGLHRQQIQRIAYLDGLTQVPNRRYFDQYLNTVTQAAARGHLSLILCDVDCFKNYNDTYGHQAGDVCLQQVATAISRAVRRTDVVARYGGEEFVVILPNTPTEAALRVAERILQQVRDLQLPHSSSEVAAHVTLSCGVVSVSLAEVQQLIDWLPTDLVKQADRALYASKKAGRDRFTLAASD
jgi:adenylate cyclase